MVLKREFEERKCKVQARSEGRVSELKTTNQAQMTQKRWKWFWPAMAAALGLRVVLIMAGLPQMLATRPEVATPLTSLRRLAEGQWLKQLAMSPYAGSMYHGSPLLLSVLGPLTVTRTGGQSMELLCSLVFVFTDFIAALLLRRTGQILHSVYIRSMSLLNLTKSLQMPGHLEAGDVAALVYLWNPLAIASCVGASMSSVENLMILLALYGATAHLTPLAAFGWAMATHLALYPAILFIPVIFLLGYGPDVPPRKLFRDTKQLEEPSTDNTSPSKYSYGKNGAEDIHAGVYPYKFSLKSVTNFIAWSIIWWLYILGLCSISLKHHGGLREMFKETYGFILTVEDLSPNLGIFWYFFTEIFDFFRVFFLLVFHANILFMVLPLTIRLSHRPCFLAFIFIAISSMLKSYPSVGDSALYLGLIALFIHELAGMRFSFLLLNGYTGIAILSPVMYNLWIWRGTGNANFYFATALAYSCFQLILVVESVGTMLCYDRTLSNLFNRNTSCQKGNS
eukprot:Gb_06539 [translate_table: standard]